MIRTSVLEARAAAGYVWLKEIGPYFGLDHRRLHLRPELIDVEDGDWCPLSHSDTEGPTPGLSHFSSIYDRLEKGREVPGTGKLLFIEDVDTFAINHGFDFGYHPGHGQWRYRAYDFITRAGSDRDFRVLSAVWRDLVNAEKLKAVITVNDIIDTPSAL